MIEDSQIPEAAFAAIVQIEQSHGIGAAPGRATAAISAAWLLAIGLPSGQPSDAPSVAYLGEVGLAANKEYQDMNLKTQLLATIAASSSALAASEHTSGQSPPVRWATNGHWYQAVAVTGKHWSECRDLAIATGGHLVTIGSSAEDSFALTLTSNVTYWIGAERISGAICSSVSGWRWVTGEPFSYARWAASQPECSPTGQVYVAINNISYLPGWHDYDDATTVPIAIFEWDADCNNDGIVDFGQIRDGTLPDQNGNNIPDTCECTTHPELSACCPGDANHDHQINGADVGVLLAYWGSVTANTPLGLDINHDGVVNGADLGLMLSAWGTCP